MKESQKLQLRISEIRQELNTLSSTESPSDEQMTRMDALSKEFASSETRFRAATIAESGDGSEGKTETRIDTGESAELQKLRGTVGLHRYMSAAAHGRSVTGAEAEFSAALGLPEGQTPLELIAGAGEQHRMDMSRPEGETRTTTDVNNTESRRRWLDRLFGATQARYLGVTFDSVPAGQATHTVTATGGSPVQRGREQDTTASAWTLTTKTFEPTRATMVYEFAIEDAARVPGLPAGIQRDMSRATAEAIDKAIFLGDTGANENSADITGLVSATGVTEAMLAQADLTAYADILEVYAGFLDGIKADQLSDLRIVSSIPWNKSLLSSVAQSTTNIETVSQVLRANQLSWRTRDGLAANTADGSTLAVVGLGLNQAGGAVASFWPGVILERDSSTKASSGIVRLIMHTLWNFGIVRSGHFGRVVADA